MQRTIFYLLMLCLLFSCKKRETSNPTIPEGNDKTSKLDAYGKALVKVEAAVNELDYIGLKVLSNLNGYPISADVNATNPLVLKWSCYGETQYLPVSGITLNKTPQGAFSRTNYGDGHCNSYPISEY